MLRARYSTTWTRPLGSTGTRDDGEARTSAATKHRLRPEEATRTVQTMYGLFGKFTAHPGKREELVELLLEAASLLESNAYCLHYLMSTSDEADAVWVSEAWTDEAAHEASLEPEEIRALIQVARPLIAGMSDRTVLDVRGGKGLPT